MSVSLPTEILEKILMDSVMNMTNYEEYRKLKNSSSVIRNILIQAEHINKQLQSHLYDLIKKAALSYSDWEYNRYKRFKNSNEYVKTTLDWAEDYDLDFIERVHQFITMNKYERTNRKRIYATERDIKYMDLHFGFLNRYEVFDDDQWSRMRDLETLTAQVDDRDRYYGTMLIEFVQHTEGEDYNRGVLKILFDNNGNVEELWIRDGQGIDKLIPSDDLQS